MPATLLAQILGVPAELALTDRPSGLRVRRRFTAAKHLATVLIDGRRRGQALNALVRDVSATGIGLEGPPSLTEAGEFAVRFVRRNVRPVWVRYAVVQQRVLSDKLVAIGGRCLGVIDLR